MLTRHLSQGLPQVGILPPQTADNRSLLRFEPFSEEPLWLISGRGHLNHLLPNITRDSTKKRYILGVAKYMISKINIQNGSIFVFFPAVAISKMQNGKHTELDQSFASNSSSEERKALLQLHL